jgi:uncharacterized protein YjdB
MKDLKNVFDVCATSIIDKSARIRANLMVIILLAIAVSSCTNPLVITEIVVTGVSLDRTALSMEEGDKTSLTVSITPLDLADLKITWSSDKPSIAVVDANGEITALKEGSAIITAKVETITATCTVTVTPKTVTGITLDRTSLALKEGENATLIATVTPTNATDKTVTWTSSNAAIATVDNTGKVSAIKEGAAIITAKAGDKTATCAVTITNNIIAVTDIRLDKVSFTLKEGENASLIATVTPSNATDKTITWTSSNTAIATVDGAGKVTAIKEGAAVIIAKAGDKIATCAVIVTTNTVAVTGISLDKTTLTLQEGGYLTLIATVTPNNATDKSVTWTSSNTEIAIVDGVGKVTAIKEGTAVIIAKAGDKIATCAVIVTTNTVAVTGITLDKTTLTLQEGGYLTLIATVTPNNATDKSVTWTSSYAAVATVDNTGKVTAIIEGTATITAQAGDKTATCIVTVTAEGVLNVGTAGTLSTLIDANMKYEITDLTLTGNLNGDDIRYIREMAGRDVRGNATAGKLINLDIGGANIVAGGSYYYYDAYEGACFTQNNVIGNCMFGAYRFGSCKLQNIILPNSATSIGSSSFYGCTDLTSITIGNNVISISDETFNGCIGLTSITLPKSVTLIGDAAFYYCSNLNEIHSKNPIPPIGDGGLSQSLEPTLYVPTGSRSAYQAEDGWKDFVNIIEE